MFKNKVLLITGGTGSFGNAVLNHFLDSDIKEIRIFSRDEKKQEDMRIEYKNDTLYVNGKPYKEPYLDEEKKQLFDGPLTESFTLEELWGEKTVPEGHLFVLGDNRRYSKDTRHIGFIPMEKVVGKTSVVYWPLSDARIVE